MKKNTDIEAIGKTLAPVFRKYRVLRALVFGSMARGEATRRSDVDLILIQDTDKRFFDRYDGLFEDVGTKIKDRAVEMLIYTPQELEKIKHRPFVARALREGKTIYEHTQKYP